MEWLSRESLARVALHLESRDRLSLALCSRKLYECLDTSLDFHRTCDQISSTLKIGHPDVHGGDVENWIVSCAISDDGGTLSVVSISSYPENGTRWLVEIMKIPQGKKHRLEFSTRGWLVGSGLLLNRLSNNGQVLVIGGVFSQVGDNFQGASLIYFLEFGNDSVKLVRGNIYMAWTDALQCRISPSAQFVAVMGGYEDHYGIHMFTADGSRLCGWLVRYSLLEPSGFAFKAGDELVYLGELDDSNDESVEAWMEQEQPKLWISAPPFGPSSVIKLLPPLPPNRGPPMRFMRLDDSSRIISSGRHFGLLEVFDIRNTEAGCAYDRRFHCRYPDVIVSAEALACFPFLGEGEKQDICLYSIRLENGIQYWTSEDALEEDGENSPGPWIGANGFLAKLPGVRHGSDYLAFDDGSAWYCGTFDGGGIYVGKFLPSPNPGTTIKYTEFERAVVFGDGHNDDIICER
ncbi:hypothetical protein NDN08_000268 [Rhodosorus marinus]|uniref:F-box domain-containing protein n=1 Tax=Rhodosorus marinus TaxID=101924 RepID=A0AAV8UJY1_9RHOD|nr:hypothetical protein NDN08_000268 [Rhodosorus marinus]